MKSYATAVVRGENARREYQSLSIRKRAILVIQKHMRKRIEWKTLRNRERAVTCLQSGKLSLFFPFPNTFYSLYDKIVIVV